MAGYKRRYAFGGRTGQDLKNSASIPSPDGISDVADYIDCSLVDIPTEIRDVIGESSNDLGTIYTSIKVNKWSCFGPWKHEIQAGVLVHTLISNPYDMSNFCGYNHNAIAPGFMTDKPTSFTYTPSDTTKILSTGLQGGEIDFASMMSATHVKWVVKDGANVVGSTTVPLGIYLTSYPIIPQVTISLSGFNGTKSLDSRIYLSDSAQNELAMFPNTDAWTITATMISNPTTNQQGTGGILFVVGTSSINFNEAFTCNITNLTANNFQPYTKRINLQARVYNAAGTLIHTQQITTADYARNYSGTIGVQVDYGYRIDFIISNYDSI